MEKTGSETAPQAAAREPSGIDREGLAIDPHSDPKRWTVVESQELLKAGFFRLRRDQCDMPGGKRMPGYYVFEFPAWANIVPVTTDGRLVMVRQYRHAIGRSGWEIPGGSTDSASSEAPEVGAARELREETGFSAQEIIFAGRHAPNAALQNNWMYTYVAKGCTLTHSPEPDPFEDLEVGLWTRADLEEGLRNGAIHHSIVIASIALAWPLLNDLR